MKLTKFFISYINYLVFISCLEVQLNVHESNGTIYNYTIINGTDSKNELFEAKKFLKIIVNVIITQMYFTFHLRKTQLISR